jgi:hypothetical protein
MNQQEEIKFMLKHLSALMLNINNLVECKTKEEAEIFIACCQENEDIMCNENGYTKPPVLHAIAMRHGDYGKATDNCIKLGIIQEKSIID